MQIYHTLQVVFFYDTNDLDTTCWWAVSPPTTVRIHSAIAALLLQYWHRRLSRDYEYDTELSARHGTACGASMATFGYISECMCTVGLKVVWYRSASNL